MVNREQKEKPMAGAIGFSQINDTCRLLYDYAVGHYGFGSFGSLNSLDSLDHLDLSLVEARKR